MRLQKQESRKVGKKSYSKWVLALPSGVVEEAGWKEGDEIGAKILNNGVLLFASSVEGGGNEIEFKETKKEPKYTPAELFLKIYDNLPLSERSEVVVVIDGEPITWKIAKGHVAHSTQIGKKILKKLTSLEIL